MVARFPFARAAVDRGAPAMVTIANAKPRRRSRECAVRRRGEADARAPLMRFVAASDGTDRVPSAAAPLAEPESESSAAVRTLQLLLLLTIVVPLVLGLAGGFVSYREHYAAAAAALDEADA